jgi:hypothetical protein
MGRAMDDLGDLGERSDSPVPTGLPQGLGSLHHADIVRSVFDLGESVGWILRLVKSCTEDEGRSWDVMEIERPDDLTDIADLGLTLSEMKRLLAALQQEIVAPEVRDHAVRRPTCSRCGGSCRVKDYQDHVVATLFGQVTVRLPRFRCAAYCGSEPGIRLATALPVDTGTGSTTGASRRPHDI